MEEKLPVENHEKWYRDPDTGSLDCCDTDTYNQYMKAYRAEQAKEKEFQTLQGDVSVLKSEMSDIKSLLLTLVQSKGLNYDD